MNIGAVAVDVDLDAQNRSQWLSKLKSSLRSHGQEQQRNKWKFCIAKLPEYRRQPPAEYTPIGWRFGLHNRENPDKVGSETLKASYADAFGLVGDELESFCNFVVDDPQSMLHCYGLQEEEARWSPEVIKHLLALDALFLALEFDRGINHLWSEERLASMAMDVVYVTRYDCWRSFLSVDLCKFENQIPLEIIARAYRYLRDHALQCGAELDGEARWMERTVEGGTINFMDLHCAFEGDYPFPLVHTEHMLGLVYDALCGQEGVQRKGECTEGADYIHIPSATKLRASGIRIKGLPEGPLCTMKYDPVGHCLSLPKLKIYDSTVSFIRNMAKYEEQLSMCMFHDYVFIMIDLIKTPEDLDFLVKMGAVENANACRAFNNWTVVGQHQVQMCSSREHNQMKTAIQERCKLRSHRLWGEFKILFCSRPWLVLSTIAAFFITVATLIQTYIAIVEHPDRLRFKFP